MVADAARGIEIARAKFKESGEKERFFHRHRWTEFYYDLRADEPGGSRIYHGIAWACRCGRIRNGGSSR